MDIIELSILTRYDEDSFMIELYLDYRNAPKVRSVINHRKRVLPRLNIAAH